MESAVLPSQSCKRFQPAVGGWERGSEIVEFAFVLTALSALILAIISFARAYNVYQTITRAAREGAHMGALPTSIYDGDTYTDGTTTYTTPTSPVFTDYIAPALRAANLSVAACTSSSEMNCIADYKETIGWMAPSGTTDNQCGISISFEYPYPLAIPFLGHGLGILPLKTSVQAFREDQPNSINGTCP